MGRMFGTDGVRGIANTELTAELAYELGRAGAYVLAESSHKPTIIVGRDTRISGDMLESALVAGICSTGAHAICIGVVPTPGVAYLTRLYNADAGVVISASHNPVEYNGIKFFNKYGYKLSDIIEDKIEAVINNRLREINSPNGDAVGIRAYMEYGVNDYINYMINIIDTGFKGFKIALDCAEGAAYLTAPEVFKSLGAEVYVIHNSPDGKNINKKCGSTHMDEIRRFTVENGCDFGFAFDGDADRCLAVDERGNIINGDFILAILGKYMKENQKLDNDGLVVTIMSNMGLDIACIEEGIKTVKTKVGDRYVLEEMLNGGYKLGGEQSGHILMLDYNSTGDGVMTALMLASVVKKSGKRLSELASIMKELPQVLQNAKVSNEKKYVYEKDNVVLECIKKVESVLHGRGRVLIRPSGTEPLVRVMLEGENKDELHRMAGEIAVTIEERCR